MGRELHVIMALWALGIPLRPLFFLGSLRIRKTNRKENANLHDQRLIQNCL